MNFLCIQGTQTFTDKLKTEPESSELRVKVSQLYNFHTFAFYGVTPVSLYYCRPAYSMKYFCWKKKLVSY